jgi:hypothetical protein
MKLLFALIIAAFPISNKEVKKAVDHQWITIDFTNQSRNHSILHYKQLDGPGDYYFCSSEGLIQHHRLRSGHYEIGWTFIITNPEACTVFFSDDLGNQKFIQEAQAGTFIEQFDDVLLANQYSYDTQCRLP